jgi:N-dimethylarginine dimethylaminohydrolase
MSIEKIVVTETVWKDGERFLREKEYSRDEHKGDFDEFILEELDDSDIKDYAREEFGLIRSSDCPKSYVDDYPTEELIEELKGRGYDIIECQTISDTFKLQKVKELMEL